MAGHRLAIVTVEGVFTCSEEEVKMSGARFHTTTGQPANLEAWFLYEWAAIVARDENEDVAKMNRWIKGGCRGVPA